MGDDRRSVWELIAWVSLASVVGSWIRFAVIPPHHAMYASARAAHPRPRQQNTRAWTGILVDKGTPGNSTECSRDEKDRFSVVGRGFLRPLSLSDAEISGTRGRKVDDA